MGKYNGSADKLGEMKLNAPVLVSELRNTNQLHLYMQGMFENDHVVYCRYGRDYIPAITK